MKRIFADSSYWIALLNPHDQLYRSTARLVPQLRRALLVTTDLVLAELLNYYAPRGSRMRQAASELVDAIVVDVHVEVAWSDQELFAAGRELYRHRVDKEYSVTDCVSMVVMKQGDIVEVLTEDRHFRQEGFRTLLRSRGRLTWRAGR